MTGTPGARLGVIADDLTGAHATAARLRGQGRRAIVAWNAAELEGIDGDIVIDMRTRDRPVEPRELARDWTTALRAAGCTRIELRVDTTLRGSGHAELAGVLEATAGDDALVIALPAYPAAGRTTEGGVQTIEDSSGYFRITDTASRIFGTDSVHSMPLSVVGDGVEALVTEILSAWASGARRMMIDAAHDWHLAIAAAAVEAVHASVPHVVTVSSGAWLAHYPCASRPGVVVAVVASPTPANRVQLQALRQQAGVAVVASDPSEPLVLADVEAALGGDPWAIVLDTTNVQIDEVDATDPARHPAEAAARAARLVAETLLREGTRCAGFVVTGGDAAIHLVESLGASSLLPVREVEPLCPLGLLAGGRWDSVPVVTKGGVIGSPSTLLRLITAASIAPSRVAEVVSAKERHV